MKSKNPNHEYLEHPKPKVFEVFSLKELSSRKELASNFRKLRKNEIIRHGDFHRWLFITQGEEIKPNQLFPTDECGKAAGPFFTKSSKYLKRFFYRRVKPYEKS